MEEENRFYIDRDEVGRWLIREHQNHKKYNCGHIPREKVADLVIRLNRAIRPNVENPEPGVIQVCWGNHEKGEKCDYVTELL